MLADVHGSVQIGAGLEAGADDFVSKPFQPEELLARVRSQIRRVDRSLQSTQLLLQKRWDRIQHGLELAQEHFRPFAPLRETRLANSVKFLPMGRIGGDFFLLEDLDEDRSLILVGDTMGKGVSASLVMAWALSAAYALIRSGRDPADILDELNRDIGPELERMSVFVAIFCGIYNRASREFCYSSAGCDPPIWIRNAGSQLRHDFLRTSELPLGVERGRYSHQIIKPSPRDRLLVYTDGLLDCVPPPRQPALMRTLYRVLLRSFHQPLPATVENMMQQLRLFGGADLHMRDDLTLLLLQFP